MIQFSANLYSETILLLVGIYLFKVNIKNTRKRCELYPKLLEKDKCICISVFIFFEKELLHNCFSCILINMCWWLFLLIKSQKMKSTVIPAFIFVINFEMKQSVSETEGIWHFRKNVKTCLQHKKWYLMPPSRHDHLHPVLILPVKMVELPQQHANTTVHWL